MPDNQPPLPTYLVGIRTLDGQSLQCTVHRDTCRYARVNGYENLQTGRWDVTAYDWTGMLVAVARAQEQGVPLNVSCKRCGGWDYHDQPAVRPQEREPGAGT